MRVLRTRVRRPLEPARAPADALGRQEVQLQAVRQELLAHVAPPEARRSVSGGRHRRRHGHRPQRQRAVGRRAVAAGQRARDRDVDAESVAGCALALVGRVRLSVRVSDGRLSGRNTARKCVAGRSAAPQRNERTGQKRCCARGCD